MTFGNFIRLIFVMMGDNKYLMKTVEVVQIIPLKQKVLIIKNTFLKSWTIESKTMKLNEVQVKSCNWHRIES